MPRITPEPLWQTTDGETVRLYWGDVIEVAKRLPGKAVDCIVTSPPYWGLRDYGTAEWEGGDSKCDHKSPHIANSGGGKSLNERYHGTNRDGKPLEKQQLARNFYKSECGKCGAIRVDEQIGSEKTPEEYVAKMVVVFRELRRVLKDTGVVWLNLGDTYAHSGACGGESPDGPRAGRATDKARQEKVDRSYGMESGNLVGIPWRVALALQADGWMLRQDIIWHKPAPMPESVQNRCTKAHEYIFLLTKSMDYYYDNEAIKEELQGKPHAPGNKKLDASRNDHDEMEKIWGEDGTRNKRSVWTVSGGSYPGCHYATFSEKLIEPCILAGTSEHGCCANCGDPYKRVVERKNTKVRNVEEFKRDRSAGNRNGKGDSTLDGEIGETYTVGWEKTCVCRCDDVVPCTVLDCFSGAGTTQIVCIKHKRRTWGIELSKKYILLNQIPRIEGELLARPSLHHLIPERV